MFELKSRIQSRVAANESDLKDFLRIHHPLLILEKHLVIPIRSSWMETQIATETKTDGFVQ
jgi:hypothetical protein